MTAQNEWSLLRRGVEREVVPACAHLGVSVLPYFPLASGMLTGKYRRGEEPAEGTRLAAWGGGAGWTTDANFDRVEALDRAGDRARTTPSASWRWPGWPHSPVVCSVIAGATTPEQVAANVTGLEWQLDADDLAAVTAALA